MIFKRYVPIVLIPLFVLSAIFYYGKFLRNSGGNLYHYVNRKESFNSDRAIVSDSRSNPSHQSLDQEPNLVLEKLTLGKLGQECHIKILIWRHPGKEQLSMGLDTWKRAKCNNRLPCNIEMMFSNRLEDLPHSDMVVIMPGPFKNFIWSKLLKWRPPGQQWVLYSRESPVHEPQFSPTTTLTNENPYNFTVTYRSDSDECITWGFYYPGEPSLPNAKSLDWARGKTKLMTWIASRCDPLGWERTKLVEEIQKHLPVDTYGRCGTLECPKKDKENCQKMLQDYKFYLSLENSECKEYFTEKFWSNAFTYNMIPVVYGAPKEDYERLAPPKSFIHLADFETMEDFVDYIKLLDGNHTLYSEYFHWKTEGGWRSGPGHRTTLSPTGLCTIIKRIRKYALNPELSWRYKNPDFHEWWEQTCSSKEELLGVRIKVDQPVYRENKVDGRYTAVKDASGYVVMNTD